MKIPWRPLLCDAHALLDEAEMKRGRVRRDYAVAASAILVNVITGPEPRDHREREAFSRAAWSVEQRIAPHGCAGCLAMEWSGPWIHQGTYVATHLDLMEAARVRRGP